MNRETRIIIYRMWRLNWHRRMTCSSIIHTRWMRTHSDRCKKCRSSWSSSRNTQASLLRWLIAALKNLIGIYISLIVYTYMIIIVSWPYLLWTGTALPNWTSFRTSSTNSLNCSLLISWPAPRRSWGSPSLSGTTLSNQRLPWWRRDSRTWTIWSRWKTLHSCYSCRSLHHNPHSLRDSSDNENDYGLGMNMIWYDMIWSVVN